MENALRNLHFENTRIVIARSDLQLYLYEGEKIVKNYSVSIGNPIIGKPTPAGRFRIVCKIKDPIMVWKSREIISANNPKNSFGARWIGIANYLTGRYRGCGIQGTNVEDSIGKEITIGCISLHNRDIIELFDLVKLGTEVIIR
jgi:lipoprotein-anchoring transpeptidase ErfK/SrfK